MERVRTPIEELDPDLIDSDRFDQFTDIHAGSPVGAVRFWNLPAIGAPMMLAARTRQQRRAGVPGQSLQGASNDKGEQAAAAGGRGIGSAACSQSGAAVDRKCGGLGEECVRT